jgi:hypothetical protein
MTAAAGAVAEGAAGGPKACVTLLGLATTGSGSTAREPAVELPDGAGDDVAAEAEEGRLSSAERTLSMSSACNTAVPAPGGVTLAATGADSVDANAEDKGAGAAVGRGGRGRAEGSGSEARSSLNSSW